MDFIDIHSLQNYEQDFRALKEKERPYLILTITGVVLAFTFFFCAMIEGSNILVASLGIFAGLSIAFCAVIQAARKKIHCSDCDKPYVKYRNKNLDPEVTLEHVYVCNDCKKYFRRVVAIEG